MKEYESSWGKSASRGPFYVTGNYSVMFLQRFTFRKNVSIMIFIGILCNIDEFLCEGRGERIVIKQNIVFIENKAGSLQKVTGLLAEAGIDIYGFACFDAPEFALFRMVTNQADEAGKILTENGYMNRVTEVIAVDLKDEVGGLNTVLQVLGNCNVNLDYIYTSYHRGNALPIMILQTDDVFVTENVLSNNGFRVLNSLEG